MNQITIFCLLLIATVVLCLDSVNIRVTKDPLPSRPISPNFGGFSLEVPDAANMVGRYPSPPKDSYVQLLRNLALTPGAGAPRLRIGGNSADESWWNPDNLPKPQGITYNIQPDDLISINNAVKPVNGSIVFDLDFRQPTTPTWAVNHALAINKYIGWDYVYALEIGNECDLYGHNGIRPTGYTFDDYQREWNIYANALYATGVVPKPRIQGATFCCENPEFDRGLSSYMRSSKSLLRTLSYHRYPLDHCGGHMNTMSQLLEDRASVGQAEFLKPYIEIASSLDIEFWVGESNSIACGGQEGISNVFGSALWAVDYMFNLANVSAWGVNFHGGVRSIYTPIAYDNTDPSLPDVRPLYYAMWLFGRTTSHYSRLYNSRVSTTNPLIKVWTVYGQGSYKVVVVHKDIATTASASVEITSESGTTGVALLSVLEAPSPYVQKGLSYSGQTFDGTRDGKPIGNYSPVQIRADGGAYKFTLKPATIAVLEFA
eukprot:TRINITY_DN2681_c0_g1_i1.p1 TRINITY_DN2681_c0_g1~~TRINITY_DN2681_c0_g1_i1.p1  ORF type:complete len:487 (+),score=97.64 TRINITY_DN2681_c0_g1_i1:46-1506(+)